MSNLTTLPKGDSAWLLRRSIQRIMQQVSVLETNIGSSTTGNSANTQVIFNDDGTLRGDAGFTYNAATDTLSVGSATITGNLTVDTNVLKVDSTNDRVGVLTASPAQSLDIASGNLQVRTGGTVFSDTFSNYGAALAINAAGSLPIRLQIAGTNAYEITSANVHQWSNVGGVAGTAMTLNSTGLGVGVTPSAGKGCLQLSSGINFPATQVASSDANTLDDYEEGTWTPVFADATTGGNVATAASAVGIYTKVGNLVTVQYQLESINTTGLTAGNTAYVRGLPFSVTATLASPGHVMSGNIAFGGFLTSNCVNGATQILFYDCLTGGSLSTRTVSNFTSGSASIYGSFTYRVA